jgi:TonB family protein
VFGGVPMKTAAVVVLLSAVAASALAAQDDPLKTARDLYASAAYEEALSELTRITSGAADVGATRESDTYRVFCLVALGRTADAEGVADALVRKDPMAPVDLRDASPRIEEMFARVRKRVLPPLIRDEYRTARALAAQKDPDAEHRLTQVQRMLAEAEKVGAWDDTLADLRVLVDGFLDLSRAAGPVTSPAAVPAAEQVTAQPPVPSPETREIFTVNDSGVIAPVVVSQRPPQVPLPLLDLVRRLHRSGTLDIVIDERGGVADVVVRQSVNPVYDSLVTAAARAWRYRPATKDGVPVRFVKTVVINATGE